MNDAAKSGRRIVFIANCVYGDHVAGGDIHFFHMAQAAIDAGWQVHFFGGHALKEHLQKRSIMAEQTCTDRKKIAPPNSESFSGQLRLLLNYLGRFFCTLFKLSEIRRDDLVYAVTDYWFDVWPAILCRAKRKLMILHMEAPSFWQIIFKSRADVDSARLASFYYWLSQNLSLMLFRFCRDKRVIFVHPAMRNKLLSRGYHEKELTYISFGVSAEKANAAKNQHKIYDAVWIGRLHRQKGIEDLLATISYLAKHIENFSAILIGNLQAELEPQVKLKGLSRYLKFSGFVSEEEKFRLFHASRVFLMPSRFEGSPRVIAEALVSEVPVVAYEIETYRPIFGDFLSYVPCFDLQKFQQESEKQIQRVRAGENYLSALNLKGFSHSHDWNETQKIFIEVVERWF